MTRTELHKQVYTIIYQQVFDKYLYCTDFKASGRGARFKSFSFALEAYKNLLTKVGLDDYFTISTLGYELSGRYILKAKRVDKTLLGLFRMNGWLTDDIRRAQITD